MRRILGSLVLLAASTLHVTAHAAAGDTRADSIDAYVARRMQTHRIPGVVWAVLDNGRVVSSGAHGFANLETRTPMSAESVFDLASLTKPFTAVAVMMLVEQGRIALDAPITTLLDGAPAAWSDVTVRHLLTHTSGLPEELDGTCDSLQLMDVSAERAYSTIAKAPLLFAPGAKAQYSDPGYILLGRIIERASGMSYRDFVQQRIFDRLGMRASSIVDQQRILEHRVAPYAIRGGQMVRGRRDWQVDAPAAFGIWSTAGDLARFDAALWDATLLADSSRTRMWTPAILRDDSPALVQGQPYGFGWTVGEARGRPAVWHGGFTGTLLLRLPEDRVSVIVLTNLDAASGRHAPLLARGIAGLYLPKYRSIDLLTPRSDASPAQLQAVRRLFADLAAGRASAVMTPAHRRVYDSQPAPRRADLTRSLGTLASVAFLACDDAVGLRLADPIARVCYYRCDLGSRTVDATLWLTAAGEVSSLRLDPH